MLTRRIPVTGNMIVALTVMLGLIAGAVAASAQGDGTPTATLATPDATPVDVVQPATEQPDVEFTQGTIVATTTDNLRVRSQPTTESDALAALPAGTELEVISGPEEAEGFTWYEIAVVGDAEPVTGWVATSADFVDAVDESES